MAAERESLQGKRIKGRHTPELINVCRWILSWFGGDCRGGEFDTCAETDDRSDDFHHNPRFRGGDDRLCCIPMPIRFQWSGSNVRPPYMTGGKKRVGGSTPDPRSLLNHPSHKPGQAEIWCSATARLDFPSSARRI